MVFDAMTYNPTTRTVSPLASPESRGRNRRIYMPTVSPRFLSTENYLPGDNSILTARSNARLSRYQSVADDYLSDDDTTTTARPISPMSSVSGLSSLDSISIPAIDGRQGYPYTSRLFNSDSPPVRRLTQGDTDRSSGRPPRSPTSRLLVRSRSPDFTYRRLRPTRSLSPQPRRTLFESGISCSSNTQCSYIPQHRSTTCISPLDSRGCTSQGSPSLLTKDNICPICLEDLMTEGVEICATVPCGNCFHHKCFLMWKHYMNKCPVCMGPASDCIRLYIACGPNDRKSTVDKEAKESLRSNYMRSQNLLLQEEIFQLQKRLEKNPLFWIEKVLSSFVSNISKMFFDNSQEL
jgi:hypothetical protein